MNDRQRDYCMPRGSAHQGIINRQMRTEVTWSHDTIQVTCNKNNVCLTTKGHNSTHYSTLDKVAYGTGIRFRTTHVAAAMLLVVMFDNYDVFSQSNCQCPCGGHCKEESCRIVDRNVTYSVCFVRFSQTVCVTGVFPPHRSVACLYCPILLYCLWLF